MDSHGDDTTGLNYGSEHRMARASSGMAGGTQSKRVYIFGTGRSDGNVGLRNLLGGKGANLAAMASIGLPGTMLFYSFVGIFVTSAAVVAFKDVLIAEDAPWDPVSLVDKFKSPGVVIFAQIAMLIATLSTNIAARAIADLGSFRCARASLTPHTNRMKMPSVGR